MPSGARVSRLSEVYPGQVVRLEASEQLCEQRCTRNLLPCFLEERGRGHLGTRVQLGRPNVHVQSDAEHDMVLARLTEDAGHLSPGDQDVIRLLHRGVEPGDGVDRLRARACPYKRE